ncbi:hypothetical protein BJX96DRAFT_149464 [Aspergillus floccosus]
MKLCLFSMDRVSLGLYEQLHCVLPFGLLLLILDVLLSHRVRFAKVNSLGLLGSYLPTREGLSPIIIYMK